MAAARAKRGDRAVTSAIGERPRRLPSLRPRPSAKGSRPRLLLRESGAQKGLKRMEVGEWTRHHGQGRPTTPQSTIPSSIESWVRTWARVRRRPHGRRPGRPRWRAFWEQYRPLALTLLQTEHVSVMEDTETPGVIWGWMARSHDGERSCTTAWSSAT